jgi:DNA replication protein DnaC
MSIKEIRCLTSELKLHGIYQSLERRLENLSKEGRTPEELVLQLLEDENPHRKNVVTKTLETRAKFRRESLLENWDSSFERGVAKSKIRDLATLGFWNLKKKRIIVGPTGSGKTQLSIAIGRMCLSIGTRVSFLYLFSSYWKKQWHKRAAGKFQKWARKTHKIRCFNSR